MEKQLEGLDLNLYLALHWLLTERNVTAAASRLGLTQPAVSRSLARLREIFDDPLLVKSGRVMIPTQRAEQLQPLVASAVEQMRIVLKESGHFNPATAEGTFRIASKDLSGSDIVLAWTRAILPEAPGLTLDIVDVNYAITQDLIAGRIDLVVLPDHVRRSLPPGIDADQFVCRDILRQSWLSAMRKDHPLAGQKLTLKKYAGLSHIMTNPGGDRLGFVDKALEAEGLTRHIACRTATFFNALPMLLSSDTVITAPEGVFRHLGDILHIFPPPLTLPPFILEAGWHPNWSFDARHKWVREKLFDGLAESDKPVSRPGS